MGQIRRHKVWTSLLEINMCSYQLFEACVGEMLGAAVLYAETQDAELRLLLFASRGAELESIG